MKNIILTGVESNNKGAELMLYAILQEIERKYTEANVYLLPGSIPQGLNFIQTSLNLRFLQRSKIKRILSRCHVSGILRRLHLPYEFIVANDFITDVAFVLDGSGFRFSDQWSCSKFQIDQLRYFLRSYKKAGTKIVYLPQAFGPVKKTETKEALSVVFKYADMVISREAVSSSYLTEAFPQNSFRQFSDFTSLVDGVFPQQYSKYYGGVCIIPNLRMVDKGVITLQDYLRIIKAIIREVNVSGRTAFLLNHEGLGDEKLCFTLSKETGLDVLTGLNALEVKGVISKSYLCISSRFHGVASALNSDVPCLATSWSHKYEELFKDYGQTECVLDISNLEETIKKVKSYLDPAINQTVKTNINMFVPKIKDQTMKMWKAIWAI
jgi:colanic acid/amylovoran biosynthesis protein